MLCRPASKHSIRSREAGKNQVRSVSAADPQNNSEETRNSGRHEELGDFSTTSRTISISALAMGIGALCAFVALALLRLIGRADDCPGSIGEIEVQ
jgi:hypothetical protein